MPENTRQKTADILKIRRGDFLLLAGLLAVAAFLFIGYHKPGNAVEISVDGKVIKTFPLDQPTTYQISSGNAHKNILEIKDGYAAIIDANCPDKLCVKQKKINKKGETLVCLPHKVIVTVISSNKEKEFDGIAN